MSSLPGVEGDGEGEGESEHFQGALVKSMISVVCCTLVLAACRGSERGSAANEDANAADIDSLAAAHGLAIELRIGDVEGDDDYLFHRLRSGGVTAASEIVVIQNDARQIRVYSPEGQLTGRVDTRRLVIQDAARRGVSLAQGESVWRGHLRAAGRQQRGKNRSECAENTGASCSCGAGHW